LEEVKAELVDDKLRRYKSKWLRHVTRKNNSRMSKIMLNYRPNGRIWYGRPLALTLLMSYIYGAPSKARNANVVYIWTYVWQR